MPVFIGAFWMSPLSILINNFYANDYPYNSLFFPDNHFCLFINKYSLYKTI